MIRVIDYETTGTDDDPDSEIIECGSYDLIETDGSWRVGRPVSFLVSPARPIPPEARAIHHISDADVYGQPHLREIIDDFLDGADICAAHNAKFEQHFTPHKNLRWICTYRCARVVWPDAPVHSNQGLRYWLGLDDAGDFALEKAMPPHRAAPDAYVTAHLLRRLLAERSIDDLLLYSRYPAILKVMNFGKHKGMLFSDAPGDYLQWIVDKSDMNEDVKFTARRELKRRREDGK